VFTVSRLLLNCDIGESFGNWTMGLDAEVMPFIDCANIACGFHAGDPSIMRKTVALALEQGVQIGAHPAYQDLVGFGRRSMACSAQELQDILHYQIGALDGICKVQGGRVSYVKPHGAMYNDMMANPLQLRAVVQAVAAYDRDLPLMLMATRDNAAAQQIGDEYGVTLWFEAFADRAYDSAGRLVSRQLPGAVHHDPQTIIEQALTIARGGELIASDGSALILRANTLCVHGDNASSVAAVQRIRQALQQSSAS
jgi:5-oxoprolinase (ATP-hydrolysing) subunit A